MTLKNGVIADSVKKEMAGSEKKKLFPENIGIAVTDYLTKSFPDIVDYGFTARAEEDFDLIANRSFIELGRTELINNLLDQRLPELTGYWWERLCRDAVTGSTIGGITYTEARRWWGQIFVDGEYKEVELDVVAESLDKKHILIGECKWTTCENGRLLTNELQKIAAALPFTKNKQVEIVLFTKTVPNDDVGNSVLPQEVIDLCR